MMFIDRAAETLLRGGIIAYPTDGVFGLGCLPDDADAIRRLLQLKHRDPAKGLILIASNNAQLEGWMTLPPGQLLPDVDSAKPVTWIVPPGNKVIPLLHGDNSEIAVRLTANPIAHSICDAVDAPLVSTSANLSGRPVARNRFVLRRQFLSLVDYLVPGDCGPASGPSEIRHLRTGQVLRPRQS